MVDADPVDPPPPMTKTNWSSVTAACKYLFCRIDPILFSSHWPVLASKTRQEERRLPRSSYPPQVATTGSSPAVRKVVWACRSSGREGGEQFEVGGKTSVEERVERKPLEPPVRRSRLASLAGPGNRTISDQRDCEVLFNLCSWFLTFQLISFTCYFDSIENK